MNPHKIATLLLTPMLRVMPIVVFFACGCCFSYPTAFIAVLVTYTLLSLIILYYICELIFQYLMDRKLLREEWLPITDEKGAVHGKVALSISMNTSQYLHPIVRIALIYKGMIFLKPEIAESGQLDYPLERYLRFRETLEEGVGKTWAVGGFPADLSHHFAFNYLHKENNRLIYLYICNIADEKNLENLPLEEGKWWTGKQIDENLNTGLFSSYFEKEYEIVGTTILPADRLMND